MIPGDRDFLGGPRVGSTRPDERSQFVHWFRRSAPYINAHRGRTFVISVGGEAVQSPEFPDLVHDLALLHSLGVRLVLVVGTRPQVEDRLTRRGIALRYHDGLRITDAEALACVKEAAGMVRGEVEARLSMGVANSPMAGFRLRVASGNFVTAKPLGVRGGVDYLHTGEVRRFDRVGVEQRLDDGCIVLIVPLGYSPTGDVFNLSGEEVALSTARSLKADKLVYLTESALPLDEQGHTLREISVARLEARIRAGSSQDRLLEDALLACRSGVGRVHLLERQLDGNLLLELFTRDGVGTLVAGDPFELIRRASIDDVAGILALTEPLERDGTLVPRSHQWLESHIDEFMVIERDGMVIASAALSAEVGSRTGELACFATHPDYAGAGRGSRLLRQVELAAVRRGLETVFVLTTRALHWFQERGFEPASPDALPPARRAMYNQQRRSRVFIKRIRPETEGVDDDWHPG